MWKIIIFVVCTFSRLAFAQSGGLGAEDIASLQSNNIAIAVRLIQADSLQPQWPSPSLPPPNLPPSPQVDPAATIGQLAGCSGYLIQYVSNPEYLADLLNAVGCLNNVALSGIPVSVEYIAELLGAVPVPGEGIVDEVLNDAAPVILDILDGKGLAICVMQFGFYPYDNMFTDNLVALKGTTNCSGLENLLADQGSAFGGQIEIRDLVDGRLAYSSNPPPSCLQSLNSTEEINIQRFGSFLPPALAKGVYKTSALPWSPYKTPFSGCYDVSGENTIQQYSGSGQWRWFVVPNKELSTRSTLSCSQNAARLNCSIDSIPMAGVLW